MFTHPLVHCARIALRLGLEPLNSPRDDTTPVGVARPFRPEFTAVRRWDARLRTRAG